MFMTNLGNRLHQARKAKRYTLREVEALSGVNFSWISHIEHGRNNDISTRLLLKLADTYGVSLDWLTGRDGQEDAP